MTVYAALRDRLLVVRENASAGSMERLEGHELECVAVDPGDPDVVLVSAARSARSAHGGRGTAEPYLYRRTGRNPGNCTPSTTAGPIAPGTADAPGPEWRSSGRPRTGSIRPVDSQSSDAHRG